MYHDAKQKHPGAPATLDYPALLPIPMSVLMDGIREAIRSEVTAINDTDKSERLISPKEALSLFRPSISKATLVNWTRRGYIPVHRIGGKIFYRYSDLMQAGSSIKLYQRQASHNAKG